MNSLYNLALRQSSAIQTDLSRLDNEPATAALQGQLTASLAAFSRTIDDYENIAKRELVPAKQEKALGRVHKFRDDYAEMRSQFARLKQVAANRSNDPTYRATNGSAASSSGTAYRSPTSATAESPFSLHARSPSAYGASPYASHSPYAPGASSSYSAYPPGSNGAGGGMGGDDPLSAYKMNASAAAMFGGGATSAREGHALREHSFIEQTENQLDAFLAQGREVLSNLVEQRGILKGTQRKLLDAANTMGLSRDVIGYIERRSTQDNIIFVVGAIFTLVCFWYIYKWFG